MRRTMILVVPLVMSFATLATACSNASSTDSGGAAAIDGAAAGCDLKKSDMSAEVFTRHTQDTEYTVRQSGYIKAYVTIDNSTNAILNMDCMP